MPICSPRKVLIEGSEGEVSRYIPEDKLEKMPVCLKDNSKNLRDIFKKGMALDKELKNLAKKDPITVFPEIHKKYIEFWGVSLIGSFIGILGFDASFINSCKEEVEYLRGADSAREVIEESYIPRLLGAYEKKTKIPKSILAYALPEELIENKIDIDELKKRMQRYIWIIDGEKEIFRSGREAEKLIEQELHVTNNKDQKLTEIKGTIAFKGVVKGRVKIIKKAKDIHELKIGEILITSMTTPNFLPAMEKAAAFVTDEGGITCHAAIVAREMKKPCIIGTKIATQVFKDGDIIEVDAEKGLVKIIKRK